MKTMEKNREKSMKALEAEWNAGQKSKDKLVSRCMNVMALKTEKKL